jgi:hypothetical protein
VVEGLHSDAKASFAEKAENLVSKGYVVFHSNAVVAFTVVESEVGVLFIVAIGRSVGQISIWTRVLGSDFFDTLAEIVDVWVVQDLCTFIISEMVAELL